MKVLLTFLFWASPLWGVCEVGFSNASLFLPSTIEKLNAILKWEEVMNGIKICLEELDIAVDDDSKFEAALEQNRLAQPDFVRIVFYKKSVAFGIYFGQELLRNRLILLDDIEYARNTFTDTTRTYPIHSMDMGLQRVIQFLINAYRFHKLEKIPPRVSSIEHPTKKLLVVFSLLAGLALAFGIWGVGKSLLSNARRLGKTARLS